MGRRWLLRLPFQLQQLILASGWRVYRIASRHETTWQTDGVACPRRWLGYWKIGAHHLCSTCQSLVAPGRIVVSALIGIEVRTRANQIAGLYECTNHILGAV